MIVVLYLTVIGIPWAIHRLIRYQFAAQAVMLEGSGGTSALRRSSDLVRGRWWHTALFVAGVGVVLGGFGLVVGLLMLVLFTGLPLWSLAVIMTLTNVLVMPLGAIAVTLLYGDAAATRSRSVRRGDRHRRSRRGALTQRRRPSASPVTGVAPGAVRCDDPVGGAGSRLQAG